ncbi:hypothetical protein ACVWZ1_000202 [Thermostichus sp. MS-CIW-25]
MPCEILAARTKAFHPAKKAGIPFLGSLPQYLGLISSLK